MLNKKPEQFLARFNKGKQNFNLFEILKLNCKLPIQIQFC